MNICKVEGCHGKVHGHGYCGKHYYQVRKHGAILEVSKFDPNKTFLEDGHGYIELRDSKYNIVGRAIVDASDLSRCKAYKWCLNTSGYVVARISGKLTYLHRFLLNTTAPHVDHIDGNPLNNKRDNIRECTAQQNSFNQKICTSNTTGTTGVYFDKRRDMWYAQLALKEGVLSSRNYSNKLDAISWRERMERKYHKEFQRKSNLKLLDKPQSK